MLRARRQRSHDPLRASSAPDTAARETTLSPDRVTLESSNATRLWTHAARVRRPRFRPLVAGIASLFGSCGGSDSTGAPRENPVPVLLSATPSQLVAESGAAMLTLSGHGFVSSSRARWNGADRVTSFQSSTTLTVQLLPADLVNAYSGTVVVFNGPPAGGTSGALEIPIGFPKPSLTSATPSKAVVGDPDVDLTLTGANFMTVTSVRMGTIPLAVTFVGSTQLKVQVPAALLGVGGVKQLTAFNPPPGGGGSAPLSFTVENPLPVVTALSPDTALTGVPFSFNVSGSGFVQASVVRWNGADRPTTFLDTARLTVTVPPGDVAVPGTVSVTVFNPGPGGGLSAPRSILIRPSPPSIFLLAPSSVQAGQGAFTLTVTGAGFTSGSILQWNGQPRPTQFLNATTLTASVTAADVAPAGTAYITVVNPSTSQSSNTASLPILPATPGLGVTAVVQLKNNHLVYDATRNVFYASVPSSVPGRGNTITKIATDGTILSSLLVGSEPTRMAISDDGAFLYVVMSGSPTVVRVQLALFLKDIEFPLGEGYFGPLFGEDIEVLPGLSRSVVVSRRNTCCSPRHEGVAIFDDGVMRPMTTQGHTGSNRLTRSTTADVVYGYNNESSEIGFRRILVTPSGLQEDVVRSLFSGADIEHDGGRVYATSGAVVDPQSMTLVGSAQPQPALAVRPDAAHGRIHYLGSGEIQTYHYTGLTLLGSSSDFALSGLAALVRWGTDGLAAGGGSSIVILRGSLVGP